MNVKHSTVKSKFELRDYYLSSYMYKSTPQNKLAKDNCEVPCCGFNSGVSYCLCVTAILVGHR